MNRNEAYETLISEMEAILRYSVQTLEEFIVNPYKPEITIESGKHFSISINVSIKKPKSFLLKGNIHENNSFKHELLEEKMSVLK